jgi:hypothetical protein
MATKKAAKSKERPVIVTTEHRGVFFGYTDAKPGDQVVVLKRSRMAIYFGTTKGVLQLADTGPTEKSRISARAPEIELRKVTAIMGVSPEATAKWEAAQ